MVYITLHWFCFLDQIRLMACIFVAIVILVAKCDWEKNYTLGIIYEYRDISNLAMTTFFK